MTRVRGRHMTKLTPDVVLLTDGSGGGGGGGGGRGAHAESETPYVRTTE